MNKEINLKKLKERTIKKGLNTCYVIYRTHVKIYDIYTIDNVGIELIDYQGKIKIYQGEIAKTKSRFNNLYLYMK